MAELRGGLLAPQGPRSTVEVLVGPTYWEIPGIESVQYDSGTRDSTTISALEGEATSLGAPSVEPVSATLAAYIPSHPVFPILQSSFENLTALSFRIRTPFSPNIIPKGTGRVTLTQSSGAGNDGTVGYLVPSVANVAQWTDGTVQRGMVVSIARTSAPTGNYDYVIGSIDVGTDGSTLTNVPGTPNGTNPGAVRILNYPAFDQNNVVASHTAVAYTVNSPGFEWTFSARMESAPGFSFGSQASSPLTTTLNFRPTVTVSSPRKYLPADRY